MFIPCALEIWAPNEIFSAFLSQKWKKRKLLAVYARMAKYTSTIPVKHTHIHELGKEIAYTFGNGKSSYDEDVTSNWKEQCPFMLSQIPDQKFINKSK